MIFSNPA